MESEPTWREIFLELAVRAFRQLNLNYGFWSLGQSSNHDLGKKILKINTGGGIQLVLEPDVCSAITQEFLNSKFTAGNYINGQTRFYEINREVNINGKKVDLMINRYEINKEEKVVHSQFPVLIEAKRAHYYVPNLKTGEVEEPKRKYKAVKEDIKKLKRIRRNKLKIKGYENYNFLGLHIYVLFWGTTTVSNKSEIESEIELKLKLSPIQYRLRFFPVSWDTNDNSKGISEWCWICLYEIDPPSDKETYWDTPR